LAPSKKSTRTLSVIGLVTLIATLSISFVPVYAAPPSLITCKATLLGVNENPPNSSPATGSITFTFDQSSSTSTWVLIWSGLTAPATAGHVHSPAPPGVNAGVVVPFTGIAAATSGTSSGSTTTLNGRTAAQFANDLLTGMAYSNIHTSIFPGGEIRGQLVCAGPVGVPEFPPVLGALAIAILLFPVVLMLRNRSIVSY
jgi:hypothetical protein